MCTSIHYQHCMGRNFDYEISYKEACRIYKKEKYKIMGMVTDIVKDYPLYYDAMNECGLCIAGLNFEGNAYYSQYKKEDKNNIAPWELPIKILGNCRNVTEAKQYLKNVWIYNKNFSEQMPNSSLHWMICDKEKCVTVESTKDGLIVYDNNVGVLTNNPSFSKQLKILKIMNKIHSFSKKLKKKLLTKTFSTRGTETLGVPGDLTSMGRFQRMCYYKEKMISRKKQAIETMHLLDMVKQPYGATPVGNKFEYTIYEVVYDMDDGKMYIKNYDATSPNLDTMTFNIHLEEKIYL